MKRIGLLDCNNFFVSCERLFRPDLNGKPVVVLSSNDGCIVARSNEVKELAVPMGIPYFQVKDLLTKHNTEIFSSHFALYRDISRRIFSLLKQEVACVEQYSVDEAFFLYEGDEPLAYIQNLKKIIEQGVGIPVSIGMAASKTQAKYAGSKAKLLDGAQHMSPLAFAREATSISLAKIWGVGSSRLKSLNKNGIKTVADLLNLDSTIVKDQYGVFGTRLQSELKGVPVYSVTSTQVPQQSIMSSRSFSKSTDEKALLHDSLAYHVRHLAEDLRTMDRQAECIRVSLHTAYQSGLRSLGGSKDVTLISPTNDTVELLEQARSLLEELYTPLVKYKKLGVTLSKLSPISCTQAGLFANFTGKDKRQLWQTLDAVNTSHGKDILRIGSRLREGEWQSKKNKQSPDYTTSWQSIPTARA